MLQEKYSVQVHCLSPFVVVHTQEVFMCSILSEQLYRESDMLSLLRLLSIYYERANSWNEKGWKSCNSDQVNAYIEKY